MRLTSFVLALILSLTTAAVAAAQATVPPLPTPPATPPPSRTTPPPPAPPGMVPVVPTTPPQAQRPPRPPEPAPKEPSFVAPLAQPARAGQNIKVDITITDSGTDGASKKMLSMLLQTGNNGQIRSTGREGGIINVDALPRQVLPEGRNISLHLTIEYLPEHGGPQAQNGLTPPVRYGMLSQSLTVVLADGAPTVVTQSADPRTDRRVTVEVTATILK